MRRTAGFTLVEMMIVVSIIAIVAAITTPNLLAARLSANETAAIGTLRAVSTAQAQFQLTSTVDVDLDGQGEFGMFRELSGLAAVRREPNGTGGLRRLHSHTLSGSFRSINAQGEVARSGYLFKVFLPASDGSAVTEGSGTSPNSAFVGTSSTQVDTDLAETTWCSYAWPTKLHASGNRTFFLNQEGTITSNEMGKLQGTGGMTDRAGAAFEDGGAADLITGRAAVGTIGRDGTGFWKIIN